MMQELIQTLMKILKKRYSRSVDIDRLYQKLFQAKAYTKSRKDFYTKYFPHPKARAFYKNLIDEGYNIEYLGSEEEFVKNISDSSHASELYDDLLAEGYNLNNLGTKKEFLSTFTFPKNHKELQNEQRIKLLVDEMNKK